MTSDYSKVFEQLVDTESDNQDLVGLLAYAIYKQKKRDWVIRFKERENHAPGETDERFFEQTHGEGDLQSFRGQAESLLLAYSDSILEDATPGIKEETLQHHILKNAGEVLAGAKRQNSNWKSIWTGFIGSLIFSVILAAVGFVYVMSGSDLLNAFRPSQTVVHHQPGSKYKR